MNVYLFLEINNLKDFFNKDLRDNNLKILDENYWMWHEVLDTIRDLLT